MRQYRSSTVRTCEMLGELVYNSGFLSEFCCGF